MLRFTTEPDCKYKKVLEGKKKLHNHSWLTLIEQTFRSLSISKPVEKSLLNGFKKISDGWTNLSIEADLPFSSGICRNGSPIEVSVRIGEGESETLRFIAQPHFIMATQRENSSCCKERCSQFVSSYGKATLKESVDSILSIFPGRCDPLIVGNFSVWLGLSASVDSVISPKMYLNPWASLPKYQGALTLNHVLKHSSAPSDALNQVKRFIGKRTGLYPHIVGLNFNVTSVDSVKIYFVGQNWSIKEIAELINFWPGEKPRNYWQNFIQLEDMQARHGEVHFALTFRSRCSEPSLKVNLYCDDFFDSDLDVLSSIHQIIGQESSLAEYKSKRQQEQCFNFLGFEKTTMTSYFTPIPAFEDD